MGEERQGMAAGGSEGYMDEWRDGGRYGSVSETDTV